MILIRIVSIVSHLFYFLKLKKNAYTLLIISLFFLYSSCAFSAVWQDPETKSPWKGIWGNPGENAVYLGLWTLHLRGSNGNDVNKLLGITYRGIFVGTFVNTFYKRSYTVGLERLFYSQKFNHYFQIDGGYRLGLIWGYKNTSLLSGMEHSIPNITKLNPIPFFQIIANVSWEMVGVQFSYSWVIVSVGFFVKI